MTNGYRIGIIMTSVSSDKLIIGSIQKTYKRNQKKIQITH